MTTEIQILNGKKESIFPIIRLTKSINGKTGTGTLLFLQPTCFNSLSSSVEKIESICLLYKEKRIESKDIQIFFREGKPYALKGIFLFKNSKEWFDFFTFLTHYSKEKGFLFENQKFLEKNQMM